VTKSSKQDNQPVYNPLDKGNLGASVAKALLAKHVASLPPEESFDGAGIYAIYYIGDFPLYRSIASANANGKFRQPIYIGKAVPRGARKGKSGADSEVGSVLYSRLKQHASSIQRTDSLNLADFRCRYLVVDDIWIPLGESLLIARFSPLWNCVVEGFGIHTPGRGREGQKCSAWDALHPGRGWVKRLPQHGRTAEEISRKVEEFLAKR
jgi:hypothetical protein